ncbi:MAG TPA: inositol monophosphatase [Micavibrio sp.]
MTMLEIDSAKIADVLKECAEKYILPRYKTLMPEQIQTKRHENDLVTVADIETELALQDILPRMIPGCVVIGEESVSSGTASLDILKDPSQTIFVVDPVDGTYNFRHGKREFAVMMALVAGGETRMGWIYDVLGDMHAITEKGAGAFLGGKRMRVADPKPVAECSAFLNPSYFPKEMRPFLNDIKEEAKKLKSAKSLYCSAHEYLQLASGQADFGINGWMKPWDHLAGSLMVQEAGGIVQKWDGTIYRPQDETGGLIIASNQDLWNFARRGFLDPALRKMGPSPLSFET